MTSASAPGRAYKHTGMHWYGLLTYMSLACCSNSKKFTHMVTLHFTLECRELRHAKAEFSTADTAWKIQYHTVVQPASALLSGRAMQSPVESAGLSMQQDLPSR